MKIVIDARFWGAKHTGLGIYTQNLVENLAQIDTINEYILIIRKDQTLKLPPNFSTKVVDVDPYTFYEQIAMAGQLYRLKPDLVHFPSVNVPILYFGKYVVTIHDLIKHDSRGTKTTTKDPVTYWFKYCIYLFVSWYVATAAKKIIVPSNDVKNRLMKLYHLPESKIVVTYESA